MRTCRRVYLGHDATLERLGDPLRAKCLTVGVPLRPDLFPPADRAEAAATLQLDPHLNTLVVTGASQGARTINEAVVEVSRRDAAGGPALQGWQVLHLAGADHAEAVRAAWRQTPVAGRVRVIDFTPEMRLVWSVADLAISRSGAGSCAEIAAFGVPAIFMPYPFHKDNHQHANAAVLADAGAAVIVTDRREAEANAEVLLPTLDSLLHDAARREAMSAAAGRVARRDAAARVAEDLLATVRFGEAPT